VLLEQLGVRFETLDADIDERQLPNEIPEKYVERLAREKALTGWKLAGSHLPALGADTVVVLDDDILLKPASRSDAERMLGRLSGRQHHVLSAVALALDAQTIRSVVQRTEVTFSEIPRSWITAYCAGEEPMDKAGAYGIQGDAARWVSHINGSFSGVMGLPLHETARLLAVIETSG
jgi:septum formation protein